MSPTASPETGHVVFTAFWDVCADGAALALLDGLGSAAKALRVNAALNRAIICFFIVNYCFSFCVVNQAIYLDEWRVENINRA